LRVYRLQSGEATESVPIIILPDDYDATTNAKYWELQEFQGGLSAIVEDESPALGGDLDTAGFNIAFDGDTGITDDAGNETLYFGKTASAVNYLSIKNAATGSGAAIESKGADTNIDLILTPKGTGKVKSGSTELIANPMTTSGDLIVGGTSGAPGRLGVGTNGHVLTLVTGSPTWSAPTGGSAKSPFPTSVYTTTSNEALTARTDEALMILDTTSGDVTALLEEFPSAVGTHYWIQAFSATPTGTGYLNRDTNVTLWVKGTNGDLTLALGETYHLYLESPKVWRIIQVS
jgi:hypothetical protein